MAGERDELNRELIAAFDSDLSDAVKEITVTNYSEDTFDPVTGDVGKTILAQSITRGIFISRWDYEVFSSNIEPEDRGLLILQNELTLTPEIGTIIEWESNTSRVVEVREDPMNVTWELRIRY